MLLFGIEDLDEERQIAIAKAAWCFVQRILSLSTLAEYEKKMVAQCKPSLSHNPHFDPENFDQELNHLMDKMRRMIKPNMYQHFLSEVQNHFWSLMDKAEAEAIRKGYSQATDEDYMTPINQFTLEDLNINRVMYCKRGLFC